MVVAGCRGRVALQRVGVEAHAGMSLDAWVGAIAKDDHVHRRVVPIQEQHFVPAVRQVPLPFSPRRMSQHIEHAAIAIKDLKIGSLAQIVVPETGGRCRDDQRLARSQNRAGREPVHALERVPAPGFADLVRRKVHRPRCGVNGAFTLTPRAGAIMRRAPSLARSTDDCMTCEFVLACHLW